MIRREVITLLGGAAAWPLTARAQQRVIPVIGTLHPASTTRALADFRQGLKEEGYIEGQNVAIVSRSADGALDRLPSLMAELVQLRVAVIIAFGSAAPTAVAAHKAGIGTDIPVIFSIGTDPVIQGFVDSLSRPGGNATGVTSMAAELAPKRLALVRELVPDATTIALLMNPNNPANDIERRDLDLAARALGWQLQIVRASRAGEFGPAFAALVGKRIGALIIGVDTFFFDEMALLATLAAQHAVPAIGPLRRFAEAGGLMSFGANVPDVNRWAGIYTAKVLKGTKPADLPVLQPTKFEIVINLKAAKTLGLTVPLTLQVAADEVIE